MSPGLVGLFVGARDGRRLGRFVSPGLVGSSGKSVGLSVGEGVTILLLMLLLGTGTGAGVGTGAGTVTGLSLIHISEPTRPC